MRAQLRVQIVTSNQKDLHNIKPLFPLFKSAQLNLVRDAENLANKALNWNNLIIGKFISSIQLLQIVDGGEPL